VLQLFCPGAKGVLLASQIAISGENYLRLRVFGIEGSHTWYQEDPNRLLFDPLDGPRQVLMRATPWLSADAQKATFLPSGHQSGVGVEKQKAARKGHSRITEEVIK